MKLGIVVSEFYWEDITSKMLDEALNVCKKKKVTAEIFKVPGSFDIPLPVKKFLMRKDIDGVVTLGAVIKGDTAHDEVISFSLAKTLQELSLQFEKPAVLGVNGPRMTWEQGVERISRAGDVTEACIRMCQLLHP
ncbi:6,7-dimethyl-8-ribityllumazine synthase [Candidatus Woesearchaeota archaeon]|nr:6,7-dimethyl-8-ribityllumazine synthase [Candidatus Woesearchaeota archaeon]